MKVSMIYLVLLSTAASFACQGKAKTHGLSEDRRNSNSASQEQSASSPLNAQALCNRVSEIKMLPVKGEQGIDLTYDSLIAAGDSVVPCLIDKVIDTTPMADPRGTHKVDTRVGDVAYFVLVDSTKIDFIAPLPPEIQKAYKHDEGVYAYHRFVEKPENRLKLQQNLRDWYKKTHP